MAITIASFVLHLLAVILTVADSTIVLEGATDDLHILALPVGQGDATIIQCPVQYGGKLTIVDMGSSKYRNFMKKKHISSYLNGHEIEMIFITHPHRDHANFIDSALNSLTKYPPVLHACPWKKYSRYVKTKGLNTTRISSCCGSKCPQYMICNKQVKLVVLASEHAKCARGGKNGDSLVVQVQYSDTKVLLMGDYEGSKKMVKNFLSCADGLLRSDIYRLSHHGANNGLANTLNLLNSVRPSYAFSSSGLHSRYKHPRCKIYHTLRAGLTSIKGSNGSLISPVTPHDYTCYDSTKREWVYYSNITDGMFVTTVVNATNHAVVNYIIKFAINSHGSVSHSLQKFIK